MSSISPATRQNVAFDIREFFQQRKLDLASGNPTKSWSEFESLMMLRYGIGPSGVRFVLQVRYPYLELRDGVFIDKRATLPNQTTTTEEDRR